MAIHAPLHMDAVARALDHTGAKTRDEHYNLAGSFSASLQANATFAEMIREARERRRLKRKGFRYGSIRKKASA